MDKSTRATITRTEDNDISYHKRTKTTIHADAKHAAAQGGAFAAVPVRKQHKLPLPLHQKIAHFLKPLKICRAKDLAALLESFPIEYLSVELDAPAEEHNAIVAILKQEPPVLKEVISATRTMLFVLHW